MSGRPANPVLTGLRDAEKVYHKRESEEERREREKKEAEEREDRWDKKEI